MQSINEIKVEFDSKSSNEAFARVVAAAFVSQLDPIVEELADIRTAVSEAVTNAIIHGYEEKKGKVEMLLTLYDTRQVKIEVRDKGKGIENIEEARTALYTSKPELERSGMGFTIMETFMDEITVESEPQKGTVVTMVKKLQSV